MNDRKKAVLLAAALFVIAVICCVRIYIVGHNIPSDSRAVYADLYQNGELLQTIRLDTVIGEYTFEVAGDAGATNTVCVRRGSIAIVSASCPDQICVHQGFISNSLLPITCLPNRLVIRVREESSATVNRESAPDSITY